VARGHNAKGRSCRDAKHVRSYKWEINSQAYQSLHPYARCLLVELKLKYDGENNGRISMSIREAQRRLGVGRKAAMRGFSELRDRRFIELRKQGMFENGMASEWELTEYSVGKQSPSKTFMSWRKPP
jgi:CTP-dependent riboflavin kinase